MKFYFLLATGLCLALGACNREKTPEPVYLKDTVYVPQHYSWKSHPGFRLDYKCMYNSLATDDNLFLYGPAGIAQFDTSHALKASAPNWYYSFLKQPINKDFLVEVDRLNQRITLKVTNEPGTSGTQLTPHFPVIDTSFQRLGMEWTSNLNEVAAISDQNQLLVPVKTRADNYGRPTFYLMGVQLNPWGFRSSKIDTTSFRKIILYDTGSMNGEVASMKSYYGKFFVGCHASTFLIRPDGSTKKILNAMTDDQFFLHKNRLYAITWRQVYWSDDEGENWVPAYNLEAPVVGHTFNLGEEAVLYNGDKIALLQIDANGISRRELVNDGVEGNQITSVCRFRDRVYVTTLSGVFYKPYRDFLTFKPGE